MLLDVLKFPAPDITVF